MISVEHNAARALLGGDRGGQSAVLTDAGEYTYAQLERASAAWAGRLRAAGVRAGDRVLSFAPDHFELMAWVLGAWRLGAVAVLANQLAPPPEIADLLEQTSARVVLAGTVAAERLTGIAPPLWHLDAPPEAPPYPPIIGVAPDHPAVWQFTQLADGVSRPVVHGHRAVIRGAAPFGRARLGIGPGDRCYSIAKLYFGYGFGNALVFPLATGATAILDDGRPDVHSVLDRVQRLRPTVFFGVPTFYAMMLDMPRVAERYDLSSVRAFVSAGEALDAGLHRRFRAIIGQGLVDGIGSTELFHVFISTAPGAEREGNLGHPTPGHDIELRDPAGLPVPDGAVGQLWVHSPHAGSGYFGDAERTAATFVDGWVKVPDLLRRAEDGSYVYVGRTDGVEMVGAQKVVLSEVDAALVEHPAVRRATTAFERDANGVHGLRARIELRAGVPVKARLKREIRAFLRARLLPHKCPRGLDLIAADQPENATS